MILALALPALVFIIAIACGVIAPATVEMRKLTVYITCVSVAWFLSCAAVAWRHFVLRRIQGLRTRLAHHSPSTWSVLISIFLLLTAAWVLGRGPAAATPLLSGIVSSFAVFGAAAGILGALLARAGKKPAMLARVSAGLNALIAWAWLSALVTSHLR